MASAYSDPTQFVRFSPHQPTLIVLDYTGDAPERAGDMVRILIERSMAGDLPAVVRILLLERTGRQTSWYLRFLGNHFATMHGYSAPLSDGDFLSLNQLSDRSLLDIVRHVAGSRVISDEASLLTELNSRDFSVGALFACSPPATPFGTAELYDSSAKQSLSTNCLIGSDVAGGPWRIRSRNSSCISTRRRLPQWLVGCDCLKKRTGYLK